MILDYVFGIMVFIYTWVTGFLLHELCHVLEAMRQGAKKGFIHINGTGFLAYYDGMIKNKILFAWAGGLYSGIILLIVGFIAYYYNNPVFYIPILTVAVVNIVYSFYEKKYLYVLSTRDYYKYHYFLYIVTLVGMFIFWSIMFW